MSIALTRIRKVAALGALCTSLTLLAACSSGSDNNNVGASPDAGTDTSPGVGTDTSAGAGTDTGPGTDTQTPANGAGEPGAEGLVGRWVLCSEVGGLRVEYEFTAATYANRVGAGTCGGFESADQVIENAGPYSITGTTMSDSGLTAFTMELTTATFNGFPVFESIRETRFRLAFTGTPGQLVFSDDTFEGEERSLTLDLESPYVRF